MWTTATGQKRRSTSIAGISYITAGASLWSIAPGACAAAVDQPGFRSDVTNEPDAGQFLQRQQ